MVVLDMPTTDTLPMPVLQKEELPMPTLYLLTDKALYHLAQDEEGIYISGEEPYRDIEHILQIVETRHGPRDPSLDLPNRESTYTDQITIGQIVEHIYDVCLKEKSAYVIAVGGDEENPIPFDEKDLGEVILDINKYVGEQPVVSGRAFFFARLRRIQEVGNKFDWTLITGCQGKYVN